MNIYTHNGPAHLDDTLATGLLLNRYPEATVVRTNKLPENLSNEDIVVDTGMKSDGVRFFDHHQSTDMPASFVQVLKYIYNIDLYSLKDLLPDLVYADLADRFGHQKANQELGVQIPWQETMTPLITNMISRKTIIEPGSFEHTLLTEIGKGLLSRIKGIQRSRDIILSSQVVSLDGYNVLYNPSEIINITLASKLIPNLTGVICKNQQNPEDISITSVNNNQFFRPERVKDLMPVVFVHATGFLAVVKAEELKRQNLQGVIKCLLTDK
jgi:hypothetical protein